MMPEEIEQAASDAKQAREIARYLLGMLLGASALIAAVLALAD